MASAKTRPPAAQAPGHVTYHFIKSEDFRILHVDGCHGGPTPSGDAIHVAVYSERLPIPLQVTHALVDGERVGGEIGRVSRDGIVRQVSAGLVMKLETAEALGKWLLETVEKTRVAKSTAAETSPKRPQTVRRKPRA